VSRAGKGSLLSTKHRLSDLPLGPCDRGIEGVVLAREAVRRGEHGTADGGARGPLSHTLGLGVPTFHESYVAEITEDADGT